MLELLLKLFGATPEQIAAITKEGATPEEATPIVTAILKQKGTEAVELYKNDPKNKETLKAEIEAAVKGKIHGTVRNDLNKHFGLGLSGEELKSKKTHELIALASEKAKKAGGDQVAEAQAKIVELTNKLTDWEENKGPELENKAKAEIARERGSLRLKTLAGDLIAEGKLKLSPEAAAQILAANQVDMRVQEDGTYLPYKPGTEERIQGKINGGELKLFNDKDFVYSHFEGLGLIQKSNAGKGKPGEKVEIKLDDIKNPQRRAALARSQDELKALEADLGIE